MLTSLSHCELSGYLFKRCYVHPNATAWLQGALERPTRQRKLFPAKSQRCFVHRGCYRLSAHARCPQLLLHHTTAQHGPCTAMAASMQQHTYRNAINCSSRHKKLSIRRIQVQAYQLAFTVLYTSVLLLSSNCYYAPSAAAHHKRHIGAAIAY